MEKATLCYADLFKPSSSLEVENIFCLNTLPGIALTKRTTLDDFDGPPAAAWPDTTRVIPGRRPDFLHPLELYFGETT